MSRSYLNLARDPFVNSRPVVRISVALWLVGALLLAGNVWLYWDFLAGRGSTYSRLQEVEEESVATRQRIASLESELAGFDLAEQNDQVSYLNARIDRRRFSWSRLFDALSEILPHDVRLIRLSPREGSESERASPGSRSSAQTGDDEKKVLLQINAVARNDQSILDTVDALFGDPAFQDPSLLQQRRRDNGLIDFNLETFYAPERLPGAEDSTESADGAAEDAEGDPPGDDRSAERLSAPASSPPEVR
jgi:hypothetical protein